jgi:hypothetical protein
MILAGDDGSAGHNAWNRFRQRLLDLDKEFAAEPRAAFMVRTLLNLEDADKTALRPAGSLSSRDVRRPAGLVDFAQLLALLRTVVKRDSDALLRKGGPVAPPGVVFFAVEPPLADAITAEAYQELAREAAVIWVLPTGSVGRLSPIFATTAAGIVADHQTALSEVMELLRLNAGIVPAEGGAEGVTG